MTRSTGVTYTREVATPSTNSKIVDEDWYGRNLETSEYAQVAFIDIDMTELTSKGTVFTECSFRGVRFNASRHTSSAFLSCSFHRCTFFDAVFADCKAVGSTFERCDLSTLSVVGGDWSFTDLSGADLTRTRFEGTRMREAGLAGAKAAGTTLLNVDLSAAVTDGADFTGADLRGSDLSGVNPLAVSLRRAVITADQAIALAEALGLDVRYD
jgi:fluoroquinolone resistance protein